MGPGALEKLRAPVLLETLALYSYMTFENAKVAKIGKGIVLFQIEICYIIILSSSNCKQQQT